MVAGPWSDPGPAIGAAVEPMRNPARAGERKLEHRQRIARFRLGARASASRLAPYPLLPGSGGGVGIRSPSGRIGDGGD